MVDTSSHHNKHELLLWFTVKSKRYRCQTDSKADESKIF